MSDVVALHNSSIGDNWWKPEREDFMDLPYITNKGNASITKLPKEVWLWIEDDLLVEFF